ncbi:MAG: 16S rRNA (cytosine(1402)-N(4))-methyltransferase RsmH [Caulobacter sp.]|nr:16S rRNA (cytosine(1402)-N(4))-methyltransferase RsmH [Caulobacter sp.]
MTAPSHVSVLLSEVVDVLRPGAGDLIVDGTFGAGGYARAFLDAGAQVTAFDRDPSAGRFAEPLMATGRFKLIEARFSRMADYFEPGSVDGVALDIGVSSMQLDEADRGFSFMRDGPLDMRMSDKGQTAADLVNGAEQAELARIIWLYGDERQSRRIASFLVRRRAERPFERTLDLAEVVERALGGRRGAKVHPATKTFQALRIAVNEELTELEAGLVAAEKILKVGGRLAVVTFHSLEDRIVKAFFTARAGQLPGGSRHAPPIVGGPAPTFTLPFKGARDPGDAEIAANPRARSAKLRAGVRTEAPAWRDAA